MKIVPQNNSDKKLLKELYKRFPEEAKTGYPNKWHLERDGSLTILPRKTKHFC